MGFVYSMDGLLCCDFCGNSKPEYNVKKIPCPYEFCQAWACCKNCKKKKLHLMASCTKENKSHKDICKPRIEEYEKFQKEKIELLNKGFWIRIYAESIDGSNMVKVGFRSKDMEEKIMIMENKTYNSIPITKNATIQDYEKFGKVSKFELGVIYQ